ncbi:hypothetical protein CYMTET_35347 [Cymbomonas tetramitiformis]|uniref:Uncharacterized protein n=1 Tax=Cymbomonas tetramitiformis TaxID=36881 RepID=A0AAE0F9R0_9CHLO|nr:hypothetical protein CYMTET_35347 [Cymbomonas tetramitiformis]
MIPRFKLCPPETLVRAAYAFRACHHFATWNSHPAASLHFTWRNFLPPLSRWSLRVWEPFTAVRWLAEHSNAAPLTEQLKVKPLTEYDSELLQFAPGDVRAVEAAEAAGSGRPMPWSPMSLCAQYARVRGFMSRGGVDAELAGKTIVQRTLDSKIAWRVASPKGDPDYPTVRGIRHGNDVASSGDQANAEHVSDAEYCSEEDEADEDEPAGRTRKSGFEALMVMDDEARDQYGLNSDSDGDD